MSRLRIPEEAEHFLQESEVALTITCPREDGNPIVAANEYFLHLTGYSSDEVIGRNCRFLQGEETTNASLEPIRQALANDSECQALLKNYKKSGEVFDNFLFMFPILGGDLRTSFFIGSQFEIAQQDWMSDLDEQVKHLVEGINRMNAARLVSQRASVDISKLSSTTAKTVLLSKIAAH